MAGGGLCIIVKAVKYKHYNRRINHYLPLLFGFFPVKEGRPFQLHICQFIQIQLVCISNRNCPLGERSRRRIIIPWLNRRDTEDRFPFLDAVFTAPID